ncbi:unnamed protein product [Notodromas monacha]|uniref:Uncharacterized protein n=1 Tax=Notodromas monacha TaxID=399045 RepID=A0A7R9BVU7_9CRUS|nr:unnamed protein product [Notodromas monacha]CAG0922736.1 unnamed protein product [Notodromas monacha]
MRDHSIGIQLSKKFSTIVTIMVFLGCISLFYNLKTRSAFKYALNSSSNWPFDDNDLEINDAKLLAHIRSKFLMPDPQTTELDMKLYGKNVIWGNSHCRNVENIFLPVLFNKSRNGTFLEAGSCGTRFSGTLHMEKELDWMGLVIEMHPTNLRELWELERSKAILAPMCVSVSGRPEQVIFFNLANTTVYTKLKTLLHSRNYSDLSFLITGSPCFRQSIFAKTIWLEENYLRIAEALGSDQSRKKLQQLLFA